MFSAKTSKRESISNSTLTLHLRTTYPNPYWYQGYINVISIDPGIANFGFRIETRYMNGQVSTVALTRHCFMQHIREDGYYNSLYTDVVNWLEQYRSYFLQSHVIIVERQLPENYQSVRLSQHVISYCISLLANSVLEPLLVEIDPKAKYKYLDAPTGYNKNALKQWGIEYATKLLEQRSDTEALQVIQGTKGVRGQKKQDDLCDTITQIEAFWKIFPIPIVDNSTKDK